MGRLSLACLIAAWALIGQAFAQALPDSILVWKDGAYRLEPFAQVLEEELYAELRASSTGTILSISRIDPSTERLSIAGITPKNVVNSGLPARTGNPGKVLTVTADATDLEWTAKGGGGGAGLSDETPLIESGTGAAGTGEAASREDHVHPVFGGSLSDKTPLVESGSGAAGTGTAGSRDDHVHPAQAATIPYSDVDPDPVNNQLDPGGPGKAATVSRGDHSHPHHAIPALDNNRPVKAAGAQGMPGTSTNAARRDHIHPSEFAAYTANADAYWHAKGSARDWQKGVLPPSFTTLNKDFCLRVNQLGGGISWRGCVDFTPNDAGHTPKKSTGTGAVGGGSLPAKWDHVHPSPNGGGASLSDKTPLVEKGAGAAGTGTAGSRDDHVHPAAPNELPTPPETDGSVLTSFNQVTVWQDLFGQLKPVPKAADQNKIVRVAGDLDTSDTEFVYDDPHSAVLAGLPALTGHGGNCVKVNATATGIEYDACGGGSSGGGTEVTYTKVIDWSITTTSTATRNYAYSATLLNDGKLYANVGPFSGACMFTAILAETNFGSQGCLSPLDAGDNFYVVEYHKSTSTGTGIRCPADTVPCTVITLVRHGDTRSRTYTGSLYEIELPGGGGGGTNPTIPAPTVAGKLKHLRVNNAGAAYELADPPQPGAVIRSIKTGSNDAGTASTWARTDHQHSIPGALYGTPVAVGSANAAGAATTLARSDHVHDASANAELPTIPGDHADHVYAIIPNKAGDGVVWDSGFDTALQDNAADIGAADRRIDDLVTPSFTSTPQDGNTFSLANCMLNVDLQKTVCDTVWKRPATWERVKLYDNEFSDWSGPTQTISVPDSSFDIHAAMQSPVTAFRDFEVHLTWAKRINGQRSVRQTVIRIGGMAPGGVLATDDDAIFYSQNSLNTVSGEIGWARLELTHDGTTSKLVVNYNVQSETFVRAILTGIR